MNLTIVAVLAVGAVLVGSALTIYASEHTWQDGDKALEDRVKALEDLNIQKRLISVERTVTFPIEGVFYQDLNENGMRDGSEPPFRIPGQPVSFVLTDKDENRIYIDQIDVSVNGNFSTEIPLSLIWAADAMKISYGSENISKTIPLRTNNCGGPVPYHSYILLSFPIIDGKLAESRHWGPTPYISDYDKCFTSRILGTVYQDKNGNGSFDWHPDEGIGDRIVLIVNLANHTDTNEVVTDVIGSYSFPINAGAYLVQVVGGGPNGYQYIDLKEGESKEVNLIP